MSRPSSLRYWVACLIAGLLLIAMACEAEPPPPVAATPEATEEATSAQMAAPTSTPTPMPVGEVRELRLSSPARGLLRMRWSATGPSPTDYHVSWARLSEDFPPPSDDAGNAYPMVASHVVTDLEAGATYKVRVRARHWDGSDKDSIRTGPWSATEATRVIAPPLAPTGLTAVATHRGVMLQWDDPGDDTISNYEVVRTFEDRFGGPTVVHTQSVETHYLDGGLIPDLGYVYTLHAINSDGKGRASEAISVTTLARIPGRDDLYEVFPPPVHAAAFEWHWPDDPDGLIREQVIEFTIENNVDDWSDQNGYYLMIGSTWISEVLFYFGLQTDVDHIDNPDGQSTRGKGAVFSRWDTRDLANVRLASADSWAQSSGHEGDFVGVRRPYEWGAGDYRARIAPDGMDPNGEWFGVWITDLATGITTWVGSLRFPLVNGSAAMEANSYGTLELYGGPTRPIDTPEWYVTVMRPTGDGVQATAVDTLYPHDGTPGQLLSSNVRYDPADEILHLRIGGITERADEPQRHWIE